MGKQTAQPQDHKLPKDAPRHVSVRGVEFDVDPDAFDDLDLIEDMYAIQNSMDDPNGVFKIVPLMRKLLGEDTYRRVKDALRDPDTGRVGMEAVAEFLSDVMEQASPNS